MTRALKNLTDEALILSARKGDDAAVRVWIFPSSSASCSAMMISSSGLMVCSKELTSRASRVE